jgi:hypothetical protein
MYSPKTGARRSLGTDDSDGVSDGASDPKSNSKSSSSGQCLGVDSPRSSARVMSVGSLRSPGVSLLIAKGFPFQIDSRQIVFGQIVFGQLVFGQLVFGQTISGQAVLPTDYKLPAKWPTPASTDLEF